MANKAAKWERTIGAERGGGGRSRWIWSCQSVFVSDPPTAGGFRWHGNQACECMSECFNHSRLEREKSGSWVSGCCCRIEFWQVAPSKGPAGSLEDALPQAWTPELISSRFNQFYGRLHWFHFFWKCTGVNAWGPNSYEYKKGRWTHWIHTRTRLQDKVWAAVEWICILVHLIIRCWEEIPAELHRKFPLHCGTTLTEKKKKRGQAVANVKWTWTRISYHIYPCIQFSQERMQ